ncbi:MAG: NAD(P)/FAD-dependent oxidoreductase, partial [Pseudomonadota bacterium]
MTETVDTVVIGAGVVGLAVARELAQTSDVMVFDKEPHLGAHTSSRNSEVIHAGIYYPAGSNKARLCVDGKHRLYDYCAQRGVPHSNVGKLIVACSQDEEAVLAGYIDSAAANGVDDLTFLSLAEIAELEPAVQCTAGLMSPSTGIVDSHALMVAMLGDLEAAGGQMVLVSEVSRIRVTTNGFELDFDDDGYTLACRRLVNSAGLWAQELAAKIDAMSATAIPPQFYAKAHYYSLSGRSPFTRLVYPLAGAGGLGVHVTVDLGGQAR